MTKELSLVTRIISGYTMTVVTRIDWITMIDYTMTKEWYGTVLSRTTLSQYSRVRDVVWGVRVRTDHKRTGYITLEYSTKLVFVPYSYCTCFQNRVIEM